MENINRNAAIGVFDSGLGGLTGVKALRQIMPGEDIIYFGDTLRVPYGPRGAETIIQYAKQDIAFLLSKNVKAIMAACGTVSSILPQDGDFIESLPVPYIGVVNSTSQAAVNTSRTQKIGIIGTEATINSGSYETAIHAINPSAKTYAVSCPLFVPLVENGHFAKGDKMAKLAAEEYLLQLKDKNIDTLVLGCTHYPLLADIIAEVMGENITLIDPGKTAAQTLKSLIEEKDIFSLTRKMGVTRYFVSDAPEKFTKLGGLFLGEEAILEPAEKVDITTY